MLPFLCRITGFRNLRALLLAGFAVAFLDCRCLSADVPAPDYLGARPGSLAKAKARLADGDKELAKALSNLLGDADEAMRKQPPTVMEKTKVPPSGDKHDYMGLAPYYWPDPKSKDGLPYIRHDGKANPESRDEHRNDTPRMRALGDAIETLAHE